MSPEPDDRSVQCLLSEKEGPEEHSAARSPSLVICIFCASIGLAATDHGMASAVIGPWEFLYFYTPVPMKEVPKIRGTMLGRI